MQRRPSKRQQHAPKSPDPTIQPVDVQGQSEPGEKKQKTKLTAYIYSKLFVTVVCILPFLAALVLFVRFYYESNNGDNTSRLSKSLHDHDSIQSLSLDLDNRIYENGHLRPEDHIYREPATQTLNWSITAGQRRPDGVDKRVYLINDVFPGPLIEARSGDTLQILVHNDLEDEQLSLHWHGLNMRGANTMDGAIGVTQCGIQPGHSFWYNFTISETQSGTFWYHAHSTVQRSDGLYGGLIVHRPVSHARPPTTPNVRGLLIKHQDLNGKEDDEDSVLDSVKYSYDKEIVLMIGDWYHRTAKDVASWYLWWGSRGYEPVPDSISLTGITLGFAQGTSIQVITLDGGNPVEMKLDDDGKSSVGILFPGQRVDFVLRPVKDNVSWMTVKLDESDFKIGNPALVTHQSFPILQPPLSSKASSPSSTIPDESSDGLEGNMIDINNLSSTSTILSHLPPKSEQTHIVYAKVEKLSRLQNIPYGFFNRTTWSIQSDPPYPLLGLPRNLWDKNQLAVSTGLEGAWVDLVVNNLDEGAHPFHFHGHSFYVVALYESPAGSSRWGSYNPWATDNGSADEDPYDLSRAVLRDTVQIPARGYAVLRFRADNPGVWMFHCHVMWHLAGGMAMLIDSGSDGVAAHEPWLGAKGMECRV
uniref:Iron transport multicopper oxidase FET3 n=1 Tax=Talaromyces marneffei PM1 TaxID=1077442 RepID=A0A093UW26_TALMA